MKKTFFSLSLRKIIGEIVLLSVVALIVVFLVFLQDWGSGSQFYEFIIELGISLIGIVIFLDCFLRIALCRIKFYEDKIIVTGDGGIFNRPIVQYKEEVEFQDIDKLQLTLSNLNSKKINPNVIPRPQIDSIYLEILLKNDTRKWICMDYFSKKQRQKMLDIINGKIGSNYRYNALWEECQKEQKLAKTQKRKSKK